MARQSGLVVGPPAEREEDDEAKDGDAEKNGELAVLDQAGGKVSRGDESRALGKVRRAADCSSVSPAHGLTMAGQSTLSSFA
jgi:hypothetical protein